MLNSDMCVYCVLCMYFILKKKNGRIKFEFITSIYALIEPWPHSLLEYLYVNWHYEREREREREVFVGYKNLNKAFVPRVILMAKKVTRSDSKTTSVTCYQRDYTVKKEFWEGD